MDVRPSCLRKFEDTYALSPGPGGTDLEHSFSCRGLFVGLRLRGVRKSFETMLDAIDGILASHLEKKYRGLPPSKPKPKHRGGRRCQAFPCSHRAPGDRLALPVPWSWCRERRGAAGGDRGQQYVER